MLHYHPKMLFGKNVTRAIVKCDALAYIILVCCPKQQVEPYFVLGT